MGRVAREAKCYQLEECGGQRIGLAKKLREKGAPGAKLGEAPLPPVRGFFFC